jgi:hypothetical protein
MTLSLSSYTSVYITMGWDPAIESAKIGAGAVPVLQNHTTAASGGSAIEASAACGTWPRQRVVAVLTFAL